MCGFDHSNQGNRGLKTKNNKDFQIFMTIDKNYIDLHGIFMRSSQLLHNLSV
ncbi:hypothetical protein PIPA1_43360 [Pelosinus sp. IPA-1]|nr:hypothetical protein PIPA1_43360 [Pelosinus sp. IPA-1]